MRSFYRVAGPVRREVHGTREVLVPRDASVAFTVERARKDGRPSMMLMTNSCATKYFPLFPGNSARP